MATPPRPARQQRMPSAVRVRRHQGSRLANFLDRHFVDRRSHEEQSPPISQEERPSQNAEPLKRPRLGTLDGDGRRASGRSISAVENLAAQDRANYADTASQSRSNANVPKSAGGRATDGHEPQLAMVAEDESSPISSKPDLRTPYFDPVDTAGLDTSSESASGRGYFKRYTPEQVSAAPDQKLPSSSSSPPRPKGTFTTALEVSGASVKSNSIIPTPAVGAGSGETRFLAPPRIDRTSATPSPDLDLTSTSSRDYRLRRPRSNVSIPTPVLEETQSREEDYDDENHNDDVADYLDVVDPEVGALGYLSNIGSSIFLPNIPALYDRRPTHNLPSNRRRGMSLSSVISQRRASTHSSRSGRSQETGRVMEEGRTESGDDTLKPSPSRPRSMLTRVTSAVGWGKKDDDEEFTKHIKNWREMDEEERDELDEHVRMLLTKKSKFKRGAKGFYAFVKTPMGFIMTLYGLLVTFWGTAIVLFIFGWIHVGHRKRYWIEICDQILCALFAAVGLGFAPFRAVDTYRMIHIAHYHHLTWKRRKQLGLKELVDPNDLPRPEQDGSNQVSRVVSNSGNLAEAMEDNPTNSRNSLLEQESAHSSQSDKTKKHRKHLIHHKKVILLPQEVGQIAEEADSSGRTGDLSKGKPNLNPPPLKRNESIQSEIVKEREDVVVLTKGEQEVLEYHQRKFHASHHFFRYHATSTHHAFPLDLMIVIVCLLDCHSILQGALGGCTWGIKYTHRPTVLTATLISCSLSCNAVAGLIIYLGGRRTKKREEVERRLKIALEQEALAKIERRRARGELPERNSSHRTPDDEEEKINESEKLAAHEKRDQIVKGLGHLEASPKTTATTSSMEMSPMKHIE